MSRRGVRFNYFIGFHIKPKPAAKVYREDDIVREGDSGELKIDAMLKILPGRARETSVVRVLVTGPKGKLELMKVDKTGRLYQPDDPDCPDDDDLVGTPYQEKLKEIANSASVQRERHLTEVAGGVKDGATEVEVPTKKVKVSRAPRRLQPPAIVELQDKLNNLTCWKRQPGDMALITGSSVFRNGATLNHLKGDFKSRPVKLFKAIVNLCLEDLVGDPGLCTTINGAKHRGKVAIPPAIPQGAYESQSQQNPEDEDDVVHQDDKQHEESVETADSDSTEILDDSEVIQNNAENMFPDTGSNEYFGPTPPGVIRVQVDAVNGNTYTAI